MTPLVVDDVPARSDACAEPDLVGVGGWWVPGQPFASDLETLSESEVSWFAEEVDLKRLPFADRLRPIVFTEPHRVISAIEMLGLLILVRLRGKTDVVVTAPVSQQTDSMVCKHITKKWYTSSEPLCFVIQELAWACTNSRIELHVGHVRGLSNVWADDLSRMRLDKFDPAKRVRVDVHDPSFWSTCAPPFAGRGLQFPVWETAFRSQLLKLKEELATPPATAGA